MTSALREEVQTALRGAYVVERELAAGQRTHLFVATETALHRRVVLKALPRELSATLDVARFRREIQLAARLTHPNIVPLLSAGEAAGFLYYTMPLVEGESLRARIQRDGALPLSDVVSIMRDLARALAFAHAHGIVHRDLKSDNVLLEEGAALLTDFGIAKALDVATTGGPTQTAPGMAVGTPTYVSPEQAAGDPRVDHRTDLYALGVLAYEMLAGRPPFTYRSLSAMLAAHRSEAPPPIATLRGGVPPWLSRLIMSLLEKRPADRPQSAEEVLRLLDTAVTVADQAAAAPGAARGGRTAWASRAWARRLPLAGIALVVLLPLTVALGAYVRPSAPSTGVRQAAVHAVLRDDVIAVLPFAASRRDSLAQRFAIGLTDELTSALGALPDLRVASRTSVVALRHRHLTALAIADSLGVGRILEGTVERAGDRLLVTTQLTSARDGLALWSATYEHSARSLLAAQDEIAADIARAIPRPAAQLSPAGRTRR